MAKLLSKTGFVSIAIATLCFTTLSANPAQAALL
jgi:hypothetical protein